MSRVGKAPIEFSKEVSVVIQEDLVTVKGPKGELSHVLPKGVELTIEENQLFVASNDKALRGTTRAVLANKCVGVKEGFKKKLLLVGIGYRAQVSKLNNGTFKVDLTLGTSHPVYYIASEGIELQAISQTEIDVIGICNERVGQAAADIRGICDGIRSVKSDPYKGKGIRYSTERVVLKETKKKK